MSKSIYAILHDYKYVPGTEQVLISDLTKVKDRINTMHPVLGTPITYYCYAHLESGISIFVIHTLITYFNADVNISINDQIPLSILFGDANYDNRVKNSKVIEYLLRYTSIKSLITHGNPRLFVLMLLKIPDLQVIETNYILNQINYLIKNKKLWHDISIRDELRVVGAQLLDHLLGLDCKERIKLFMQCINYIHPINPNDLLKEGISCGNTVLTSHILDVYKLNLDPNIRLERYLNIADLFDIKQFTKNGDKIIEPIISKNILDNCYSDKLTVISNYIINIPGLLGYKKHPIITQDIINSLQIQGDKIMDTYLHDRDLSKATKHLGFNNNIFHFLALMKKEYHESWDIIYHTNPNGLMTFNMFGQSPIKLALLINNQHYIRFCTSILESRGIMINHIDIYDNKIGHILAKEYLSQYDLRWTIEAFKTVSDFKSILGACNKFGQSPIHLAVQCGNYDFIDWWDQNGGMFDLKDHSDQTVWHYFAHLRLDIAFQSRTTTIIEQIHQKLVSKVGYLINVADNLGITTIQAALQSKLVLKYLLEHHDDIDLNHQDNAGNTISHEISRSLSKNIFYTNSLHANIELVRIFIPYKDKIKDNYNIKNKAGQYPINIIEHIMLQSLPVWLHNKISHDILKKVSEKPNIAASIDTYTSTYSGSSDIAVKHAKLDNQPVLYDNRIIFFSPEVLTESYRVNALSVNIQELIMSLSFEIAYSKINQWGDTTLQVLLSIPILEVANEVTTMHILNVLDQTIKLDIYNTHNALGEYLSHLAVQSHCHRLFAKQLSDAPDILYQKTEDPNPSILAQLHIHKYVPLYPYDYAVILQNRNILEQLHQLTITNRQKDSTFAIPSNLKLLIPDLTVQDIEDYIAEFLLSNAENHAQEYMSPKNQHIRNALMLDNDNIRGSLSRMRKLEKDYTYFPTYPEHLKFLQSTHSLLISETEEFVHITSLSLLSTTLVRYKNMLQNYNKNSSRRMQSIAMLYNGHASSLVIFKDMGDVFNAIIHDSMYSNPTSESYNKRFTQITKVLYEILYIDQKNIYELKVPQQDTTEYNCGLWTIVNIKLIQLYLLEKEYNCLSCFAIKSSLSLVDHKQNHILQNIEHALTNYAPRLVDNLQAALIKCHDKCGKIEDVGIPFQKLFDMLVVDDLIHDQSIADMQQHLPHVSNTEEELLPLTENQIRNVIDVRYHGKFDIFLLSIDYNSSANSLIVVQDPKKSDQLAQNMQQFIDTKKETVDRQYTFATRTFIIEQDNNHWVTLVVALNKVRMEVYFADSYGLIMPSEIRDVVTSSIPSDKNIAIYDQVVSILQQEDKYNGGLWAIENAIYIHTMLVQNEELSSLKIDIKNNLFDDRSAIINMRTIHYIELCNLPYYVAPPESFQALKEQKEKIALTVYQTSCFSLTRRRRTVCDEEPSTEQMVGNIREFKMPENDRINTELYFNILYIAALQNSTNNKNVKIKNTLQYIGDMYYIFTKDSENLSQREQDIIKLHYTNVNELNLPKIKHHLLSEVQYTNGINHPVIFYNDYCAFIVYYEHGYYLLYSQNYHNDNIYKTKSGVTFNDLIEFINLFFSIYSSRLPIYQVFILADNQYSNTVIRKFTSLNIWDGDDATKSDLRLLWELKYQDINNIPKDIIYKIFFVNGKVPDIKILNDNFFDTHLQMISLRVEQIHKAFLYLNPQQILSLKNILTKYHFDVDRTYLKKILATTSFDIKFPIFLYHKAMTYKLKNNIKTLTLATIEKLTLQVLAASMQLSDIPIGLSTAALQYIQKMHKALVHHAFLQGYTMIQAGLFMPDLIKTVNYNQHKSLMQSVSLTISDITLNELYRALIDKLKPYFAPSISKLLDTLPTSNPIFKILTFYSFKQCIEKLDTIDPSSVEYDIISHKLKEEYVTIGLMMAELFNLDVAPLWFMSMIERLRYEGHQISLLHNLDIPVWEETLMGLGFYQDKVNTLVTESNFVSANLALLDKIMYHFLNDRNQTNSTLYIIQVPDLSLDYWESINENQVPQEIKQVLHDQVYKEDGVQQSMRGFLPALGRASYIDTEYNGYRVVYENHNYNYYLKRYNVSQSNTNITFDDYDIEDYKTLGPKDEVFIDKIRLLNQTWLRLPQKYESSCLWLELWCDNKPKWASYVLRNTGNVALYYRDIIHQDIDTTIWAYVKNIIYIYDPRETNMYINFTQKSKQALCKHANDTFHVNVFVQHKDYPDIVSYLYQNQVSSFILQDSTDSIVLKYFITHMNSSFTIHDNANTRDIVTMPTQNINNTYNTIVVTGDSKSMVFNSAYGNKSYYNQMLSNDYKNTLTISLSPGCVIGSQLVLSDTDIYIKYLQGQSKQSNLFFTKHNKAFALTLVGNIILHDSDDSSLAISGNYRSQLSSYSKSYVDYVLIVQNFLSVFSTIQRLDTNYNTQHIKFNDANVDYNWYRNQSEGHLVIKSSTASCCLQLGKQFDVLEIYDTYAYKLEFIATMHYDAQMQSDSTIFLKHIFINTTKIFTNFDITQNIHNIMALTTCDSISYAINGSILLFSNHNGHEWYNIFPFSREININSINYQITQEGICYTPPVGINKGGYTILEYIYNTELYSEKRIAPICILDTAKDPTRSKRYVSEDNENQDFDFKMQFKTLNFSSSFYSIQVRDNIGYISNNTVHQDLDEVGTITESLTARVASTKNIVVNSKSTGSKLLPPLYNFISTIWQYFSPTQNKEEIQKSSVSTYTFEPDNLGHHMLSDVCSLMNCNNYTTNISNNLIPHYDYGNNTQKQQVTDTINIHNNLAFGHVLLHRAFGKNKLLNTINYISPQKEQEIMLQQISEKVLGALDHFIHDYTD